MCWGGMSKVGSERMGKQEGGSAGGWRQMNKSHLQPSLSVCHSQLQLRQELAGKIQASQHCASAGI